MIGSIIALSIGVVGLATLIFQWWISPQRKRNELNDRISMLEQECKDVQDEMDDALLTGNKLDFDTYRIEYNRLCEEIGNLRAELDKYPVK
jgi:hypothetical protein